MLGILVGKRSDADYDMPVDEGLKGKITAYDPMDQLGTVELDDGRTVRFGISACPDFRPYPGSEVLVSKLVVGYQDRIKAKMLRPYSVAAANPEWVLERLDEKLLPDRLPDNATLSPTELSSQLDAWAKVNAPSLQGWLGAGASTGELDRLSEVIGYELPPAFRSFWTLHNGAAHKPSPQQEGAYTIRSLIRNLDLLDAGSMLAERDNALKYAEESVKCSSAGPVKPLYWSPGWVPFAVLYGSSHYLCLDLDPPPEGDYGQVIEVGMKFDQRRVLCKDVLCLLEGLLLSLQRGEYQLVDMNA